MSKGKIYIKKTTTNFFKIKMYIFSKRDTFAEKKINNFIFYQNNIYSLPLPFSLSIFCFFLIIILLTK